MQKPGTVEARKYVCYSFVLSALQGDLIGCSRWTSCKPFQPMSWSF